LSRIVAEFRKVESIVEDIGKRLETNVGDIEQRGEFAKFWRGGELSNELELRVDPM